jgi:hypothetical protein
MAKAVMVARQPVKRRSRAGDARDMDAARDHLAVVEGDPGQYEGVIGGTTGPTGVITSDVAATKSTRPCDAMPPAVHDAR